MIVQAIAISLALSIDAFAVCFAYGAQGIKIPMRSVQLINLICSGVTGLSLLAGSFLENLIPSWLTTTISVTIMVLLGLFKLLDSFTKALIRRHNYFHKKYQFSLFSLRFILILYADPEKADLDRSATLELAEAASLAFALSLDGIAVGFGAALANICPLAVFLFSFLIGMALMLLGDLLGRRLAKACPFNLSFLGGVILIVMAIIKLF